MAPIQTKAPTAFFAGDTVKWIETLADYLPADGWSLVADFTNAVDHYTVSSTDDGHGSHVLLITSAVSAGYVAGDYRMGIAAVNAAGERYTIQSADISVRPNLAGVGEARSQVKKDLDALNSWITSGDPKVAEYTIAGRSMKYHDPLTLEKLRAIRKREYRNEQNADHMMAGGKSRRRLVTRMQA